MVKVKNIQGTSKDRYAKSYPKEYGSWLDYWNAKCGYRQPYFCANKNCINTVEVGAHVIKEGSENDRKWYIVPLCKNVIIVPIQIILKLTKTILYQYPKKIYYDYKNCF